MAEGGFFSRSASAPTPDQAAKKQAVMEEIKGQIALANAQELINNMNEKCYSKCITKPSTDLSSSEQTCLTRCMDRYLEAFNVISQTYVTRVSKERNAAEAPVPGNNSSNLPSLS